MNLNLVALITGIGLFTSQALAADARQLTLTEAVQLALGQNRELKIARLKVEEYEQKKASAKASYFPEIKNQSSFLHTTAVENINIPRGAFGPVSNAGDAAKVCASLQTKGVACRTTEFDGQKLSLR